MVQWHSGRIRWQASLDSALIRKSLPSSSPAASVASLSIFFAFVDVGDDVSSPIGVGAWAFVKYCVVVKTERAEAARRLVTRPTPLKARSRVSKEFIFALYGSKPSCFETVKQSSMLAIVVSSCGVIGNSTGTSSTDISSTSEIEYASTSASRVCVCAFASSVEFIVLLKFDVKACYVCEGCGMRYEMCNTESVT